MSSICYVFLYAGRDDGAKAASAGGHARAPLQGPENPLQADTPGVRIMRAAPAPLLEPY